MLVSQIRMDGLTGQWVPYTKIWLRAMSTLFQANARLSWSGADAFVPNIAYEYRQSQMQLFNPLTHAVNIQYSMFNKLL